MKFKMFLLLFPILFFCICCDNNNFTSIKYNTSNNELKINKLILDLNDSKENILNKLKNYEKDFVPMHEVYELKDHNIFLYFNEYIDQIVSFNLFFYDEENKEIKIKYFIINNKIKITIKTTYNNILNILKKNQINFILSENSNYKIIEPQNYYIFRIHYNKNNLDMPSSIYFDTKIDQQIIDEINQKYDFEIKKDNLENNFDNDFYKTKDKDDFYNKINSCYLLYDKWRDEEYKKYRDWQNKESEFKTKVEKYKFNLVSDKLFSNLDKIYNYGEITINKLIKGNEEFSKLDFKQVDNFDKYIIKEIKIIRSDVSSVVPFTVSMEVKIEPINIEDVKEIKIKYFDNNDNELIDWEISLILTEKKDNYIITEFNGSAGEFDLIKKLKYIKIF